MSKLQVGTVLKCIVPTVGRKVGMSETGFEISESEEILVGELVVLSSSSIVDSSDWTADRRDSASRAFPILSSFFIVKQDGTVLRLGCLFKNVPDAQTNEDQLLCRFSIVD